MGDLKATVRRLDSSGLLKIIVVGEHLLTVFNSKKYVKNDHLCSKTLLECPRGKKLTLGFRFDQKYMFINTNGHF